MTQIPVFPHILQNGPGNIPDAEQLMANWAHLRDFINNGQLGADNLASNAVTADKIATGAVTRPKLSTALIQTARHFLGAGGVSAGSIVVVTVSFAQAFADTNYTATATIQSGSGAAEGLTVMRVDDRATGSIDITVKNTAGGTRTGTLNVIAIHD